MLEVLKFIFSSFWVWLGTVVLIVAIGESFQGLVTVIRRIYK